MKHLSLFFYTTYAIIAIVAIFFFPLTHFLSHQIPQNHDSLTHVTRAKDFDSMLRQGHFPVRWSGWSFNGAGSTLFNHYQVGFYYLNSLLGFIPKIDFPSRFLLTVSISWLLIPFATFLLTYKKNLNLALTSSLIITLSPHLLFNIFTRGAYPEVLAFGLSLLTLFAFSKILKTNHTTKFHLLYSLSLGLLIITHLPTTLVFIPIFFVYLITHTKKLLPKPLIFLSAFTLLGIGLASFYLFPAILELGQINTQGLTGGAYDFHFHFVSLSKLLIPRLEFTPTPTNPPDELLLQLGFIQLTILLCYFLKHIIAFLTHKHKKDTNNFIFVTFVVIYSLLFQLKISQPIWDLVTPLQFLQFPWRLNMLLTFAASLTLPDILKTLPTKPSLLTSFLILIVCLIFYHQYTSKPPLSTSHLHLNQTPQTLKPADLHTSTETAYLPTSINTPPDPIYPTISPEPQSQIKDTKILPHKITYSHSSFQPTQTTINRLNYPGWKIYSDHTPISFSSTTQDLIKFNLPPGNHQIKIIFTNTPIRFIANLISLLSILTFSGILLKIKPTLNH